MDITAFTTVLPAVNNSKPPVEQKSPALAKDNPQTKSVTPTTGVEEPNRSNPQVSAENQRIPDNPLNAPPRIERNGRVLQDVNSNIELRKLVIEQKNTAATQAFLDVAEPDTDFRLIDVYV